MSGFVRRVVTGHDKGGKAIVLSDDLTPNIYSNPLRPGHRSTDIWTTIMPATISRREPDPTLGPQSFLPLMGVKIRISELEPEPESVRSLSPEEVKEWYDSAGHPPKSAYGHGGRHPLMHRTQSIDYAVVLEGEMTLVMDDQDILLHEGDVVVQRGTNHAWSNRSRKRVRMLYILIDASFDEELSNLFREM